MVLDYAMKAIKLDPLLYADDGILFTNNIRNLKKLSDNEFLKEYGIIISEKKKKDGSPSFGLIRGENIGFVGSVLNVRTGIISSKKR